MKVKDLKRVLASIEDDRDVILAIDEEGNGFLKLRNVELAGHLDGDISYDEPDKYDKCVVLWP